MTLIRLLALIATTAATPAAAFEPPGGVPGIVFADATWGAGAYG